MKNPRLLFLDVETLGLGDAPIWEIAAVNVSEMGNERDRLQRLIKHDPLNWVETLPPSFQDDYESRYSEAEAVDPETALGDLLSTIYPGTVVCGSNPSFDMERIQALAFKHGFGTIPWHYHPEDVPTLARGWLNGKGVYPAPPWKSDLISQMCGVDPRDFNRHTAMGDCRWMLALWRKVNGS